MRNYIRSGDEIHSIFSFNNGPGHVALPSSLSMGEFMKYLIYQHNFLAQVIFVYHLGDDQVRYKTNFDADFVKQGISSMDKSSFDTAYRFIGEFNQEGK